MDSYEHSLSIGTQDSLHLAHGCCRLYNNIPYISYLSNMILVGEGLISTSGYFTFFDIIQDKYFSNQLKEF